MKREDLKTGQKVHVEFDAVVRRLTGRGAWVETPLASEHSIHAEYMTRTDPEYWPPQVGDIWELDGQEYIARAHSAIGGTMVLQDIGGSGENVYEQGFTDFKNCSPTLVRRRGQ